jgi:hypothetical protein
MAVDGGIAPFDAGGEHEVGRAGRALHADS